MATCGGVSVKVMVLLLFLSSLITLMQVADSRPTTRGGWSGEESDIDSLLRQMRAQTSRAMTNDVNDAVTLISFLVNLHRQRKQADGLRQQFEQRDYHPNNRQKRCYWNVVTCF